MLKKYYPSSHVKSPFTIDYKKLYGLGYKGLIFDIDNTLVHHGADGTEQTDMLLKELQCMGFKLLLLTNNDETRVKRFLRGADIMHICEADKPSPEGYIKALEMLGLKKEQVLVIGDQVFSDIAGANGCGIPSILVDFIRENENAPLGKKRWVEKLILGFYRRSRYFGRISGIEIQNVEGKEW